MIPTAGTSLPHREAGHDWFETLLAQCPGTFEAQAQRFLAEGGPGSLYLFGAGYQGALTLSELSAIGLRDRVRGFIDNQADKIGQELDGVPIVHASILETLPRDAKILVTTGAYRVIEAQLAAAGFTSGVRIFDLSALRNGLFDRTRMEAAKSSLRRLHAALGDARSQETLEGILAFRLTGDLALVEALCEPLQYFPPDLLQLGQDEVFIDGGAFDGDTIRSFLEAAHGQFEAIHAFEPDPRNFDRLRRWIDTRPDRHRIRAVPQALFSHRTSLRFVEGPSMSSRIESAGTTEVEAISLDAYLDGRRASFIKYDLEGAEPEALQGARNTLQRWKPTLPLSVYHAADHLWTLAAAVQDLLPHHRLFLRHYSALSFETVLYALPSEP